MICEQIPNKGLSAGNVSTRYVEELMRVRKFKSFGKIQGGHAHFWPWEFYVKNSKSLYINNHGMWVLHTHVLWHGKSIYTISFTLRPSPDPFLTTPMPYRGNFLRKIQNFRISIIITCGYSTAMFFDMRNRFTLLVLHSNHHLTHFWIHAIPWEFSYIYQYFNNHTLNPWFLAQEIDLNYSVREP